MAEALKVTPLEEVPKVVARLRQSFNLGCTRSLEWRRKQLLQMVLMIDEQQKALSEAVFKDLHKHPNEVWGTELLMIRNDAIEAIDNLKAWTSPVYPSVTLISMMDDCRIMQDPLGVVLVIGAWNYPVQLTLVPLIGAIAAGNCAIVKPSEVAPHTAQLLGELVARYLDPECVTVVNGAVAETSLLLDQKFDHILYTGSSAVGKIVMAAAAKKLCPVTLELGGKSPCIVDATCDMYVTARRIVWGRFLNAGQTCIAPDYVLALPGVEERLLPALQKAVRDFFGDDPQTSSHYGRIINKAHFNRVCKLIGGGEVVGGKTNDADFYIAPTFIKGCSPDAPVMQEEIFGPILPIVTVASVDAAIAFVNDREKPLVLYVFSTDSAVCQAVANRTSSGGFIANDTLMHALEPNLPFGGVGNSGMGTYHGKRTFDTFTHRKAAIFKKQAMEFVNDMRYPPYSDQKTSKLNMLGRRSAPSAFRAFFGY